MSSSFILQNPCHLCDGRLIALHTLTDGIVAFSYFAIITIMYFSRKRATKESRPLAMISAVFFLSCGLGYAVSAWNIWHGYHWTESLWRVVVALLSVTAAWRLIKSIPMMMSFHRQLTETELLANTDYLTGLVNRRGLEEAIYRLSLLEPSSDREHTILLLDIDHFKSVNDVYGHATGDRLLRTVASILSCHTRSIDIVARLGGDEFVVALVACSLAQGKIIAETIRKEISQVSLENAPPVGGMNSLITASIGLQSFSFSSRTTFEDILRATDKLMYASKLAGRDCITDTQEGMLSTAH